METHGEVKTSIVGKRFVADDALLAETEVQEACVAFVRAERIFRALDANPRCVTDSDLNLKWWNAMESMYQRDRALWRLFVGPQPDMRSNKLYAKFRELLLKGKSLRADA